MEEFRIKDTLGNSPMVGDKIAYATRRGSSLSLTPAVVLEVKENSIKVRPRRKYTWESKDPVTLKSPKYIILGIEWDVK